ncbi:hypothetical protein JCM24511_07284 [Saitozyma sp. JCM 24511]|nr:hypothetical protein JCM24511_07284 [Saitozyma sp. JCM 24511]
MRDVEPDQVSMLVLFLRQHGYCRFVHPSVSVFGVAEHKSELDKMAVWYRDVEQWGQSRMRSRFARAPGNAVEKTCSLTRAGLGAGTPGETARGRPTLPSTARRGSPVPIEEAGRSDPTCLEA